MPQLRDQTQGRARLDHLAAPRPNVAERLAPERPHELHRDRARPLGERSLAHVAERGPEDAADVHAAVLKEAPVLDRDVRFPHELGDLLRAQAEPERAGHLREEPTLPIEDPHGFGERRAPEEVGQRHARRVLGAGHRKRPGNEGDCDQPGRRPGRGGKWVVERDARAREERAWRCGHGRLR